MPVDFKPTSKIDFAPESNAGSTSTNVLDSIDPEIAAKRTTSYILGKELGLDDNTVNSSYSRIVKNVYGKKMSASQVQSRMEDDGILVSPKAQDEEIRTIAKSVIDGVEPPADLMAKRYKRETTKQTVDIFNRARVDEEDLFTVESDWLTNVQNKPDMPDTISELPLYNDTDLLNFDTFKGLVEQMPSQQAVRDIRSERKSLIARIRNRTINEQADFFARQEVPIPRNKYPKLSSVSMGLYSAATTVERGIWGTSVALGMTWNQPELENVEKRLEEIGLAFETMPGKMPFVISAVSEAIPNFAYNMAVGRTGIFITEYGNSYADAINNGASETQANAIAIPVATINTIIEGLQLNQITKAIGKGAPAVAAIKKGIKDRAYKAFLKKGAKFAGDTVKTGINEGIEGFLQEGVQIAVPAWVIGVYPKDENGNVDWLNILGQMGRSFIGEGLGGAFLGGAGSVYNSRQISTYKTELASKLYIQEGLNEKEALLVATNVVERLRNNDGQPQDVMREELSKVKLADNRHKAHAHILKNGKEMSDKQYRQIAKDVTGKESMKDMTLDEAERFIKALQVAKVEKEEVKKPKKKPDEKAEPEKKETTPEQIVKDVEAIRDETEPQPQEFTEPTPEAPVAAPAAEVAPEGVVEPTKPSEPVTEGEVAKSNKELLAEIDEALTNAPEKGNDTVTFNLGDGVINIVNTKKTLEDFRKRVRSRESTRSFGVRSGKAGKLQGTDSLFESLKTKIEAKKPNSSLRGDIERLSGAIPVDEHNALEVALIQSSKHNRDDLLKLINETQQASRVRTSKEGKGFRGGFLDNAPIGNEEKLRQKLEQLIGSEPKRKKVHKKEPKEPIIAPTKAAIGQSLNQAGRGIDRAFGLLSTRLKNISLGLFQDVRNKYINPTLTTVSDRVKVAHGLIDGMSSKFNAQDKKAFDKAVWQADDETINKTIAKYGLQDEYAEYRSMMDVIFHEARAVGMDLGYLDVYFPSMVKDFDGLMDELNRREEYEPIVMAMLMATDKKGRKLSRDEQIQLINSMLRGFQVSGIALGRPGFAKERTVSREDLSLKKYYFGFEEAISRYIESMTENIHARQFFGKTTAEIVKLRAGISRNETLIARYQKDKSKDQTANIKRARTRIKKLQAELDVKDDGSLDNSIGTFILDLIDEGKLKLGQQEELLQIFQGIFQTTRTDKWLQTLKSLEFAGSLAQVSAVITQYGEVILPLIYAPGSTLPNWVKAHLNKSNIKLSDLGVAHVGQEWVDADLDGAVKWLMKPFELADRVGKETYVNSIIDKYRKMAIKNPDKARTEIRKYYPEEGVEAVLNSLKSGEVDNNVKGFALNELADVQPISKMEVPEIYSKAGNLRIFYMYKTFILKRIDILRREGFAEITAGAKSGDKERIAKGIARLLWLSFMFTLADSSMDVIKDFVKGKPLDKVENYVIDNLLQTMMLSKFSAAKSRREGPVVFLKDNIVLPVSNINAAAKDVMTLMDEDSEKGSEFARRIPWIGDMYFWYFGEGARKLDEGVYDD